MKSYQKINAQTLLGLRYFRNLTCDQRESMVKSLNCRRYNKGNTIIPARDEQIHVFFIVSGEVKITHNSTSGKEISFQVLKAGDSFGEVAAIDGPSHSADAVAHSEVFALAMSAVNFRTLLNTHPAIAAEVLHCMTELVRRLSNRVIELSTWPVNYRIRAELIRLANDGITSGNEAIASAPPTHAEIAAHVSTHREAVTREVNRLKREGILDWDRTAWRILDLDAMRESLPGFV